MQSTGGYDRRVLALSWVYRTGRNTLNISEFQVTHLSVFEGQETGHLEGAWSKNSAPSHSEGSLEVAWASNFTLINEERKMKSTFKDADCLKFK